MNELLCWDQADLRSGPISGKLHRTLRASSVGVLQSLLISSNIVCQILLHHSISHRYRYLVSPRGSHFLQSATMARRSYVCSAIEITSHHRRNRQCRFDRHLSLSAR